MKTYAELESTSSLVSEFLNEAEGLSQTLALRKSPPEEEIIFEKKEYLGMAEYNP